MSVHTYTKRVTVRPWSTKPARMGVVELVIDMDKVAQHLAEGAFWSKKHKSRALSGAIVASAHSIEDLP